MQVASSTSCCASGGLADAVLAYPAKVEAATMMVSKRQTIGNFIMGLVAPTIKGCRCRWVRTPSVRRDFRSLIRSLRGPVRDHRISSIMASAIGFLVAPLFGYRLGCRLLARTQ